MIFPNPIRYRPAARFWWAAFGYVAIGSVVVASGETASDLRMRSRIDQHLSADWVSRGIQPATKCSDSTFLRRAYLDLVGRVPRVSEAREFLESEAPDRRDRLIADLVQRPGYATRMANVWRGFLLPVGTELERTGGFAGFEIWLRDRIADNTPYDALVRELLLADGQATESGPGLFFTAWELKPEKLAASTSRALLGMQVQCAECHDHPFDRWSQRDFWSYAAFFARLEATGGDRPAGIPAPSFRERTEGEVSIPESEEVALPRFLGDSHELSNERNRREQLADWIVNDQNPYFARAVVNRVWAQLFGRGIVHPPDNMGAHNPPSHPELLDDLATYFQQSGYDIRQLVRTLAGTRAYQLSSKQDRPRPNDAFAQMAIKTLTAEQLYDSLATATCKLQPPNNGGQTFGINRILDRNRQAFLNSFRSPSPTVTDYQLGIAQALTMLNGNLTNGATSAGQSDLLGAISAPIFNDDDRVEMVFLAAYARPPTDTERQWSRAHVAGIGSDDEKSQAFGDLFWALLNSSEFTLNR